MPNKEDIRKETKTTPGSNEDLQGNDKAPGEEKGLGEKVTNTDLKGKIVDADPSQEEDKPVRKPGTGE